MVGCAFVGNYGQRRVRSPAAFGRAAGNKETGQHDNAADEQRPETGRIDFGERHIRRTDLQWHDKVAEGREGYRHNAHKDHDRAVHCAQRVIKLGRHFPVRHAAWTKEMSERIADHRQRRTRKSELPAH